MNLKKYKWPIITVSTIIILLILIIAIGYPSGILSENPDGLERVLIDYFGESWLENLKSPWNPILGWIENQYIAGIIGVIFVAIIMSSTFYLIMFLKKRKIEKEN
ncbi:MAG: hypothetical protein ACFFAK_09260 [Promethearchaeota archaeon]